MKFDLEKRNGVKTMMLLKKLFLPKRFNKARRLLKRFPAYLALGRLTFQLVAIVLRNARMHSKVKGLDQ